jgi:hypothetical protein
MEEVELGDEVECKVTGFKGIANGKAQYMTGCERISVQPRVTKDGKHPDGMWIDKAALKILKKGKVKVNTVRENNGNGRFGGPSERVIR